MQPAWPERSNDVLPFFRSYRIGPATAYNLFNKIPIIDEIINTQVNKEEDTIVFCFGEVDIRAHLIKQVELQKKFILPVVRECVDRYYSVVSFYRDKGYKVAIWAPIASWSEKKPYRGPSFGDDFTRNLYTSIFTFCLRQSCKDTDIKVLSILRAMLKDELTDPDYLDDWEDCHIHLNLKAMPLIIEEFKEKGLI
jgi:hypothetical protein